jgi:hypothetical protein
LDFVNANIGAMFFFGFLFFLWFKSQSINFVISGNVPRMQIRQHEYQIEENDERDGDYRRRLNYFFGDF